MYCAECGNPLKIHGDEYLTCCNNKGYWCDVEPDRDDGCLDHVARVGGLWLYVTDSDFVPSLPKVA